MSMTETPVIQIQDMFKTYPQGEEKPIHALDGVSLDIMQGEYVSIVGQSGSGKSTLMNMIGLLAKPTSGSYRLRGIEVSQMSSNHMALLRNREIGFIFQSFHLLARSTAQHQVELPMFYANAASHIRSERAQIKLSMVGLADRLKHRPEELSGGQKQRVAIARALVNEPSFLLADEPTGALDSDTSSKIMNLFHNLHKQGMTLVVVTHDPEVAQQAERIITLKDGRIISDERLRVRRKEVA